MQSNASLQNGSTAGLHARDCEQRTSQVTRNRAPDSRSAVLRDLLVMTRKYPTISDTLKLIREMGLRASYVPEFHEFRVSLHHVRSSTYYTTSRHDALFTAKEMRGYIEPR